MPYLLWNEHATYLADSVSELYRNSEFFDCILDVEGGLIEVHKTILAACSSYFKNLLKSHHVEEPIIPMKEVNCKDLKLILDFIYNGKVDVTITDMPSLIKTAELMEITSLKLSLSHCFQEEFSFNDQPKRSIPNTCDSFIEITKQDQYDIYDELTPLSFVAVSLDSVKNEKIEEQHDDMRCFDLDMKDSLGEYSGSLNITEDTNVKKECTSQSASELLVKKEPKEDNDDRDSDMSEGVLIAEKMTHLSKLMSTESSLIISCDQESCMRSNPDVVSHNTVCSESCTKNETHNMEMKFESICEISESDVNEEKLFVSGRSLYYSEGDDAGTSPLEPPSESQIDDQHFSSINLQQDVNEEECGADASKISSPFFLESGNQTPVIYEQPASTIFYEEKNKLLMTTKESEKSHDDESLILKKQRNSKRLLQRHPIHQPLKPQLGVRKGLIMNLQTLSTKVMPTHTREEESDSDLRPLKCGISENSFSHKGHFIEHMVTQTGDRPFECEMCKKSFSERQHLKQHMRTHTGERPFVCDICTKSFSWKGHFKTHMRTHTGERPYECKMCNKSFSRKGYLKSHMRAHTGDRPFVCDICEKSFSQKSHLNRHMQTHNGDRPFVCDICQKSYSRKEDLKRHNQMHKGERPFECEMCAKSFSRRGHLKQHMTKHTGEKLFECVICRNSFSRKGDLKRHMRTHTGDRPYV